ncbi:MFS transporter [Streptomyces sp. NEAU-Y11]|uniref:MFS transporter n=1 Tax=Streptomyces cucumeris TaxID=2962890 RepID=UPI0020C92ADD|nr:MFS transporter [Streptomyces sp. NEAU-Y11]MCP9210717.1 MFS transporter [Streptomyces sp. NEAU-Y11]
MTVTTARPAPPAPGRTAPRPGGVLALMSSCVILTIALVAAINLAIPQLNNGSLHPSSTELLWIVDAYVIVFACLLIPAGALGDRCGRKGALLSGLALFTVGALASALAPGPAVLIAARALTGAGAALIMPATLSLALQTAPPERRPHTIAVWTAATGAAGMAGNLGGGLILQYLPWQGLFWCVAPISLVLFLLTARYAPRGERHPADPDIVGTVLIVLGFVALLFGVIEGPERGWTSATVLGAFAASVVVLTGFVLYALRAAHPLIDPRVFAVPRLRAGVLGVTLTFFGLFALFFVNAQFLQYVKGYSPVLTGLAIGPLAIGMLVVSRHSIPLGRRIGAGRVIAAGLISLAGGLALLSLADADTPYPLYAAVFLVTAAGMGLSMPMLSASILGALPHSRAGLGSGLGSAAREVGSALGVAVMGTVLTARFTDRLPDSLGGHADSPGEAMTAARSLGAAEHARAVAAFTDAMTVGFRVVAAVVAVLAVVVVLWFREEKR